LSATEVYGHPLLHQARKAVYSLDRDGERRDRRETVHRLVAAGYSSQQIGWELGITDRSVDRHRTSPPIPAPPPLPDHSDVSDALCAELEQLAILAAEMAASLRDENPAVVWHALSQLGRRGIQELAVILLAIIPIDKPLSHLLAWVNELPAAKQ
jgi:hypothetical protein